jgi:hypothetical protein
MFSVYNTKYCAMPHIRDPEKNEIKCINREEEKKEFFHNEIFYKVIPKYIHNTHNAIFPVNLTDNHNIVCCARP